jgi:hypothetical protein
MAEVVVVVAAAGLEAVVVVAGLMVVVGALGAADGVCATATEAIVNRIMNNTVVGFIVRRFC